MVSLAEYDPVCTLELPRHAVQRARVGAIDAHAHLGRWLAPGADWVAADLAGIHQAPWLVGDVPALLDLMDSVGVQASVNLDGRWDLELEANLDRYDRVHPERFFTFCQLDWRQAAERHDFADVLTESLRRSAAAGARGLKVWKTLGLGFRDRDGRLLLPDDERLAPIFAAAGELRLPVLIHTADPPAFFAPVDARNERLEELHAHPEWSFCKPGLPSHARLMESLEALVAAHPRTTFIAAHVAGWVENLAWVGALLARYANLYVDIAARIPDLGRQPRAARALILTHEDRILFGTDALPPSPEGYRSCFRFLETADECYAYSEEHPPPSGRWQISALDLPERTLRNVYCENARRALGLAAGPGDGAI